MKKHTKGMRYFKVISWVNAYDEDDRYVGQNSSGEIIFAVSKRQYNDFIESIGDNMDDVPPTVTEVTRWDYLTYANMVRAKAESK